MEKFFIVSLLTIVVSFLCYPILINYLHQLKFGQSIRVEGPQSHHKKKGTPTMGGIGFVVIPFFTILITNFSIVHDVKFWLLYLTFFAYGIIGFLDDYLIVVQKKNDGLKATYKLLAQIIIAVIFFMVYKNFASTVIVLPFFSIDLGIFYSIFLILMFVAESNAVNLTDGIDGLCTSVYLVALVPFGVFAYFKQEWTVLMFIVALASALIVYLQFNKNPAKVFMGDTGSLALGGVLAVIAVLLKVEILLIVIGGVFLIETLSVMIQVAYYKRTKKRIFLMSPIHHHYELKGLNEKQIVRLFSTVGVIFAILGVILWTLM